MMESYNGTLPGMPICPRCSHQGHLIHGLLKTPPVCTNCAVDSTWVSPQENWPEDRLTLPKVEEYKGQIGPSRIIVQHPHYSICEQVSGHRHLLFIDYKLRRIFKLPKCNENITSGDSLLRSLLSSKLVCHVKHLDSSIEKTSMAQLSNISKVNNNSSNVSNKMTNSQLLSYQINLNDRAAACERDFRYNQEVEAGNIQNPNLPAFGRFLGHTKLPQSMIGNACKVLHQANASQMAVERPCFQNIGKMHTQSMLCCALKNPLQQNCEHLLADCCWQANEVNCPFNQDISQMHSKAMPTHTQHARFGNLVEYALPQEKVTDCPYKDTLQANMYHTGFNELHNDKLGTWHQNNIWCCQLNKHNAFPTLSVSTEHVTNNWPNQFATHNINPTGVETQSIFHNKMPGHKIFHDYLMPEQESIAVKASKWNSNTVTQENQIYDMPICHIEDNQQSTSINRSKFYNPKQLPQHATQTEQAQLPTEAIDLTCKTAAKENQTQIEAEKPSNQEVNILYPYSIFNSNLDNPESQSAITGQGKLTEHKSTMASNIGAILNDAQVEQEKLDKQQMLSTYPYSIFNLLDPKSLATATKQVKLTKDVTPTAPYTAAVENHALIELEKICNQQMLNTCHPSSIFSSDVGNNEPIPVSLEQATPMEEVIEKAFKMATEGNCTQIQRGESSGQEVIILEPSSISCNQLQKPGALPKLMLSPDHVKPPQKATDLTQKTASTEKAPHTKEGSKSTNTEKNAFASLCKLPEFETAEDFLHAVRTGMLASYSTVLSNNPVLQNTTENENEDKRLCTVHDHPKMPDLEFTFPDKTNGIVEAVTPEKAAIAVDQENSTKIHNDNRLDLKEAVSEEILAQNKNPSKLESDTETEGHNLRNQQATIKQITQFKMEHAEDVSDNEYTEKCSATNDISDNAHPRSQAFLLEDASEAPQCNANCQQKESTLNSNIYKDCKSQTEIIMNMEEKSTPKMELNVCSERLRDDGMDLKTPQFEEKAQNTKNARESHEFERCRPAKDKSVKNIKIDSMPEKANEWKSPTKSNPQSDCNKRNQLPKEDICHMIISKGLEAVKAVKEPEDGLQQAIKTQITPQLELSQASKLVNVHGKQPTADSLEEAKDSKAVLRNVKLPEKSDEKSYKKRRSSQCSKDDMPSLTSSFEDREFKISAKKQRIEVNSNKSCRIEIREDQKTIQPLGTQDLKRLNLQQFNRGVSLKCPKDLLKLAHARDVEKPIEGDGQIIIAKPERYSKEKRKEEQPSPEASGCVAIQQNKAKTGQRIKEKGNSSKLKACKTVVTKTAKDPHTSKKVKTQKLFQHEAVNFTKKRSVEMQKNASKTSKGETAKQRTKLPNRKKMTQNKEQPNSTASGYVAIQQDKAKTPRDQHQEKVNASETSVRTVKSPKTTKDPHTHKEVKSQKPLIDEATNLTKTESVEIQQNANLSNICEGETAKQWVTVHNERNVLRTQNKESRSECSKDNVHCKTQKTIIPSKTPHNPKTSSESDCKLPRNAAQMAERCLIEDSLQILGNKAHTVQISETPEDQSKLTQHHSTKMQHTDPNYMALCARQVDRSVREKNLQSNKTCTSASHRTTERSWLQNQKRKSENSSDDDHRKVQRMMASSEKPKDSKISPNTKCKTPKIGAASERERHPKQKSKRRSNHNQNGNNSPKNHKAHRVPPMITQTIHKRHSKEAERSNLSPDFNAMSESATLSPNTPHNSKGLSSHKSKKKPSTITSEKKVTHFVRSEIEIEMPRIQNQEKGISDDIGCERAHKRGLHQNSKRPSDSDHTMPKKTKHSILQSHAQHVSKEHWVQNQDNQSDAWTNVDSCKIQRKNMPSETLHEFSRPCSRYHDKPRSSNGDQNCEQETHERIKDPRVLARVKHDHLNAGIDMLLASMSDFETSSYNPEPLENREERKDIDPVLLNIQMHVFDKKSKIIIPHTKAESIYKWSKILIKTVPSQVQSKDINKDKYVKWQQLTSILTQCAKPDLIFREWKNFRNDILSKSICFMSFKFLNNTLEISIYAHSAHSTVGLWACVRELNNSATLQRRKYFIANVDKDKVDKNMQQHGEFQRRNARERHDEDVKLHEVTNKERHEPSQRHTGRYSNEYVRSRREYWDRMRMKYRRHTSFQERSSSRFSREKYHPIRQYGPRSSFSRDRGYYDQRGRAEDPM